MKRRHDRVLIAGGGPVGSTVALLLARAGVPVTLIEREPGMVLDYRASTFHPPTLDLLEDSGISAALLSMGLIAPAVQIRDRRAGKVAEFDLSILGNDTRHPYRLQCEQFKLVDWLYGALAKIAGVEVLFGHEVTGLAQTADEVAVETLHDGARRKLKGDILIGCDGG